MENRCIIISGGVFGPVPEKQPGDFIIACDAGYRNCARLGCKPDIIVGDFDSAPCPQQNADDIVVLPHVKDDTDTEYAAKLAAQKGFDEVLLLGALGGRRVEHTLANLCTGLGLEQRGIRAALQDERSHHLCAAGREPQLSQGGVFLLLGLPHGGARRRCVRKRLLL